MKCFEAHSCYETQCSKSDCRQWIDHKESMNCTLIAARKGPMTLQEIGDIFGVTRMRICQLEKRIIKKIENFLNHEARL